MAKTPANLAELPPSETWTAPQALAHAARQGFKDVVVIGFDQAGRLNIFSSRMSRGDAILLIEHAKLHALAG